MQLGPPREGNKSTDRQEFPRIVWNMQRYYRVHRYPPVLPILSQTNPIRTISPNLLRNHFPTPSSTPRSVKWYCSIIFLAIILYASLVVANATELRLLLVDIIDIHWSGNSFCCSAQSHPQSMGCSLWFSRSQWLVYCYTHRSFLIYIIYIHRTWMGDREWRTGREVVVA